MFAKMQIKIQRSEYNNIHQQIKMGYFRLCKGFKLLAIFLNEVWLNCISMKKGNKVKILIIVKNFQT